VGHLPVVPLETPLGLRQGHRLDRNPPVLAILDAIRHVREAELRLPTVILGEVGVLQALALFEDELEAAVKIRSGHGGHPRGPSEPPIRRG